MSWAPRPSEASVDVLAAGEDNAPYRVNAYMMRFVCTKAHFIKVLGSGSECLPKASKEGEGLLQKSLSLFSCSTLTSSLSLPDQTVDHLAGDDEACGGGDKGDAGRGVPAVIGKNSTLWLLG